MTERSISQIEDWHAHVYFDATSRELAWAWRDVVARRFGERVQIGRFNEVPVGPHPTGSYELALKPADLGEVLSWLVLNHGTLDLLVHPNTGEPLRDHTEGALWLGNSHRLHLEALRDSG